MLTWIVKSSLIRLYDVLSIIIFSASVNIIIWGSTVTDINCPLFYPFLILSFGSFVCGGWCSYWLYDEVKSYIRDAAGVEESAITEIHKSGMSSKFKSYFLLGIVCSAMGIIFFLISARL